MANSKIPYVNLTDTMNTSRLKFNQLLDSVGDVSTLTTAAGPVVGAINEHDAELGTITSVAMGTTANTVSTAIAELDGRLDSINEVQLSSPKIYLKDSSATSHIKGSLDIDTNLNVGGNLVINGTAAIKAGADGNIDLGDGTNATDTVTFNANVASSIVPENDNLYDLGENNQEWRHGYFDGTVYADELQSDSATIGTLKVTDLTNNRVTIAGAGGEIEDDPNFTFDGTALSVGNTSIDIGATGINTTGLEADSGTIGTLKVTDLNNNRVVIVGDNNEIEDDPNFTFDGTTLNVGQTSINRLAIGINTTGLEADSATITANADVGGNLDVVGNLDVGGNFTADGHVDLGNASTDTVSINGQVDTDIVPSSDNARSLGSNLQEWKHGYFDGTVYADELAADSATITGDLDVQGLTTLDSATIDGDLNVTRHLDVQGLTTLDSATVDGGLGVTGDLNVDGITTLDSATVDGDLDVTGLTTLDSATVDGDLGVTNNLDVTGDFKVNTNKFTVTAASGNTTVAGTLGVTSNFNINTNKFSVIAASGNTTVAGTLGVTGNTNLNGNVDLGNQTSDTISFGGRVDTDILPSTNDARSLGSNGNQWKDLHVNGTGYIDEVSADSATIGTLKVTDLTGGRIVIVGSEDSLTDDGNFTFDGTTFTVGNTTIDIGPTGINTTGLEADSATITQNISVGGNLEVTGGFTVGGTVTFTGDTRTAAAFQVMNDGITIQDVNRAGLAVDRPGSDSAIIQWNELGDYWEAGVTTDLGRLALQGDSAQFLRVDGTTGSFDTVDVSGNLSATGNLDIDGLTTLDSATVDGDLVVTGNFTVGGTTTFINTEEVTIDDNIIVLNNNATGVPAAIQDAGIEVERGDYHNIQLLWDESEKYWVAATDSLNTLSRIATANWLDATSPIVYNSTTGNISHATSGVAASTYGQTGAEDGQYIKSIIVNATGHITGITADDFDNRYDNYSSWTAQDSDGTTYTITSGDTLTFRGDDDVITTNFVADDVLKISHKKSTASSSDNSGNTFIQDLTLDSYGHITALGTGSVSISDDTITISPRNGLKTGGTFTLNGSATTVYIDIDSAELRDDYIEKLYFDQLLLNSPGFSTYQGNLRSSSGSFRLSHTNSDITNRPVSLGLMNTDTTLSDGSTLGYINFEGENSNGERITYSLIEGSAVDVTDATEDGQLELKSKMSPGTLYTGLDLNSGVAYLKSYDRLYLLSEYNSSAEARFRFANPTTAANTSKPSYLEIYNNNPDPTDNMDIGEIGFFAKNSFSVNNMYADIRAKVKDFTGATEDGELEMRVAYNGGLQQVFLADSNTSVLAAKDIYLVPTGDNVYMRGTTAQEQIAFNLSGSQQSITSSDSLTIQATNLTLDASGDIYLDAQGQDIYFTNGTGGDTWTWNLPTNGIGSFVTPESFSFEVDGTLNMMATDNAFVMYGANGTLYTDSIGQRLFFDIQPSYQRVTASDDFQLQTNDGYIELKTYGTNKEIKLDATGNITLDADGNNIYFKNGGGLDEWRWILNDNATGTFVTPSDFTIDAAGDIYLDAEGNNIYFKNGTGGDTWTWTLNDNASGSLATPGDFAITLPNNDNIIEFRTTDTNHDFGTYGTYGPRLQFATNDFTAGWGIRTYGSNSVMQTRMFFDSTGIQIGGDFLLDAQSTPIFENAEEVNLTLRGALILDGIAPLITSYGDITLAADGNNINFTNGSANDTWTWTLSDNDSGWFTTPGDFEINASGDLTLETATSGNIYLRPKGVGTNCNVYIQDPDNANTSLEFYLAGDGQVITASQKLNLVSAPSSGPIEFEFRGAPANTTSRPPNIIIRNSDTAPVDGDTVGDITFQAENFASEDTIYGRIQSKAKDVSDTEEDGDFSIWNMVNGTEYRVFRAEGSATTLLGQFVALNSENVIQFYTPGGYYQSFANPQPSSTVGGFRHWMTNSPSANTANGDITHELIFNGKNGSGSTSDWARIKTVIVDGTNLAEYSKLQIFVEENGANSLSTSFHGSGVQIHGGLYVGDSATPSFVQDEIRAEGDITAFHSSDISLKENIVEINNAMDKINSIRGVYFDWTDEHIQKRSGEDGYFVRKHDVGVIAQEVEQVLPEVVRDRKDGTKAVDYQKMVALLIEGMKEQQQQIDDLKEEIRLMKE